MITGIFGLPGAGKSSFLAYLSQRATQGKTLCCGHLWAKIPLTSERWYDRIYSNFPMRGCYKLDWENLGLFDFSHSLILIDEIMHVCDARDWKDFDKNKKYFFSMARHMGTSIIYASQGYADTDVRIRNLTAQILYIRNEGAYTSVTPVLKSWDFKHSIDECYALQPPIARTRIRRKKYYHLFDSYTYKKLPENPALLWEM